MLYVLADEAWLPLNVTITSHSFADDTAFHSIVAWISPMIKHSLKLSMNVNFFAYPVL